MASFVDARGKHLTDADDTSTALLFLPLRTFVSSIRDGERDVIFDYSRCVGWKLQPTNLLENNEARVLVEIQKSWNVDRPVLSTICLWFRLISSCWHNFVNFIKILCVFPNIEFSKEFFKSNLNDSKIVGNFYFKILGKIRRKWREIIENNSLFI